MRRIWWIGAVLGIAGCQSSGSKAPDPVGTPSILVITLDTLRGDRVHCYGYERETSPRLDEFARTATLYREARASSPWTLPSHATMFTGLYAFEHGARTYWLGDLQRRDDLVNNAKPLAASAVTLAERLRAGGYQTAAVIANEGYLTHRFGMDQGFDHYDVDRKDGASITDRALAWLSQRDERPFFLFLNYMDTHKPYNTTPVSEFMDPSPPLDSRPYIRRLTEQIMPGDGRPVSQDALSTLRDQYDVSVRNVDREVGRLLDGLRAAGSFDDMVILITSDHGEFFGEHDLIEHSKDVYEPGLVIPFLWKDPGQTGPREVDEFVSLVHVPWLLAQRTDALSADDFPYAWPDAFVLAENHFTRMHDLSMPWGHRFHRSRLVIYEGGLKYIHSSDQDFELFDLARDPRELDNLVDARPQARDRLTGLLESHVTVRIGGLDDFGGGTLPAAELDLSPEEIERLRSLGYLN